MYPKSWLPLVLVLLSAGSAAAAGTFRNVSVDEGRQLLQQRPGLVLLDVRTPQEYFEARLEGAKLLPTNLPQAAFYERLNALPKEKPYLVYCTVGSRSSQVMSMMQRAGFTEVYNLDGGIAQWYRKGYPILQGAP